MNKLIILGLFVLATGCTCTPEVRTVTKTELRPIAFADTLLRPCPVTPPPNPEEYVDMDSEHKEAALTNYTVALITDIGVCNGRLENLKATQDKEIQVYKDMKNKPKEE